ncbi:MAG TPA: HIT domain-containing protein [Thermoguttaceae bacterium]|nr:HIT domain-containing protein [Thermoguttaceae bacterium]HPP54014.1 HIT domain-containing protein [Thermoguttaceae bacterium]
MANEQIWAPWRLAYIRGENNQQPSPPKGNFLPGADPECFLCQAVADPEEPLRYVIGQTAHSICVLNRYPYTNGHLLAAPRRHCERLELLSTDEQLDLLQLLLRMIQRLEKTLQPHGFNVGFNLGRAAGAGLPGHLHWHIVPRWQGDTNFMPILASVNVIPQSLEALRELLVRQES